MSIYRYKATCLECYDGDTCTLQVDLGFNMSFVLKARLYGIDTPELRSKDSIQKEKAYKARDYLRKLILGKEVRIETHKQGKYGRYLVDIYIKDENDKDICINDLLVFKGLAKYYDGGKR